MTVCFPEWSHREDVAQFEAMTCKLVYIFAIGKRQAGSTFWPIPLPACVLTCTLLQCSWGLWSISPKVTYPNVVNWTWKCLRCSVFELKLISMLELVRKRPQGDLKQSNQDWDSCCWSLPCPHPHICLPPLSLSFSLSLSLTHSLSSSPMFSVFMSARVFSLGGCWMICRNSFSFLEKWLLEIKLTYSYYPYLYQLGSISM